MAPTTTKHLTAISASAPTMPRLRMEPTCSRRTLLDGGWWPRSTDPIAELPGLVLAIDSLRGLVTRLVLGADGWDEHPRRLDVAGRVLRLGYFTSQPTALLTALCDNGDRVDLLVVPPDTEAATADAALVLAAATTNLIRAQHLLAAASAPPAGETERLADEVWETDGGPPADRDGHPPPARTTHRGLAASAR